MSSGAWFIVLMLAVTGALLIYHVRNPVRYFKTGEGRDAAVGMGIVVAVLAVIVLLGGCSNQGRFATDAHIFGGLEYTKKPSPMCQGGGTDDRGTSHVGLGGTLWETLDGRTKLQARYTHHSCFIGSDDRQYDAFGAHLVRKVWAR